MDSQNIFDVFGRQIKSNSAGIDETIIDQKIRQLDFGISETEVDKKIRQLKNNFEVGFNKFLDHVKKTDELVKAISISKNYLSLEKKKRIVGVNRSINGNDVVIKSELNEAVDSLIKVGKDLAKMNKQFNDHIKEFDKEKDHIRENNEEINELRNQVRSLSTNKV